MKLHAAVMALLIIVATQPVEAGDRTNTLAIVSEDEVRMVSETTYTELIRQALEKGWRYTPEQIERGYRRHFEEFKLQLIDQGYTIVVGEAGA